MVFLTAAAEQGNVLGLFMPFIIMLGVFTYFDPPSAEAAERAAEYAQCAEKGDKVVTIGGIHGEITALKDDVITLRIADKVEIRVSRSGIGRVV